MGDPAAALPPDHGGLLVVDDEPFLREAVAASLRFLGFEVTTAQTGSEALRLARDRPFDLVVLDVMLPGIDGFELCAKLREAGNFTPVLMLTARNAPEDRVRGLDVGADDSAGSHPCSGVDCQHHASISIAPTSASATSSPATLASA